VKRVAVVGFCTGVATALALLAIETLVPHDISWDALYAFKKVERVLWPSLILAIRPSPSPSIWEWSQVLVPAVLANGVIYLAIGVAARAVAHRFRGGG
jgi:hypothetical protein